MELIAVLELLWRRRLLLILGIVVSAASAFALGPSGAPPHGFAVANIMLDTARSQFADDATFGAETLTWRATLAAQTLGTDENRRTIAAVAHVAPKDLDVTNIELTAPLVPASLPRAAVKAAYSSSKPFALDLHTNDMVPIITVSASAPDRAAAARLVDAGVKALERYTVAPPDSERLALSVRTVTPIDSVAIPGGHGRKKMAAIAVILICMWTAALAVVPMLLGALRRAIRASEIAYS